ncbi:unnamed protein product [Laminaria digitata]
MESARTLSFVVAAGRKAGSGENGGSRAWITGFVCCRSAEGKG